MIAFRTRLRNRSRRGGADEGAVLILALVFMVSVGMITIGLLSFGNASLFTTIGLQNQRNVLYGADAALETAIQSVRSAAPPSSINCPSTTQTFPPSGEPAFTINGRSFVVKYCVTTHAGFYARNATFTSCLASDAGSCLAGQSNGSGGTGALIQANVVYNDVKAGCVNPQAYGCYGAGPWGPGFWGTSLSVQRWNVLSAQ